MEKYIALLRGINVGGKNKISMPELKIAFEESGFTNVKTYINSGNVIFTSASDDHGELKRKCEVAITEKFNLSIPVAIISSKDLTTALHNAPAWWGVDRESTHNAIFVIPPATAEALVAQVGVAAPEYEQLSYYGQVIFWSAKIKTFSRAKWSKIAGTPVYGSITVRNANTTKKPLQLAEDTAP